MRYAPTSAHPHLPVEPAGGVAPGRAWRLGLHVEWWLRYERRIATAQELLIHPPDGADQWTYTCPDSVCWPADFVDYVDSLYGKRKSPFERLLAEVDGDGITFVAQSDSTLAIHFSTKETNDA